MVNMKTKKICIYGFILAVALIFSYVEYLIPLPIGIPGVKLGLANCVILVLLYRQRMMETAMISIIRVVLMGILFGNASMMVYSLAGALMSLAAMGIIKKRNCFSIIGVSIVGGVFHNIGQLLLAMLVLETTMLGYYFPILLISGCVTGAIIGMIGSEVIKRIRLP